MKGRRGALGQYHAKAERRLDALVVLPTAHPAGRALQAAVKAWRTKFQGNRIWKSVDMALGS